MRRRDTGGGLVVNTRVMGAVKDQLGMQKQKLDSISGKLSDIGH